MIALLSSGDSVQVSSEAYVLSVDCSCGAKMNRHCDLGLVVAFFCSACDPGGRCNLCLHRYIDPEGKEAAP